MYSNDEKKLFAALQAGESFGKISYWDYSSGRPFRYLMFNTALQKHYCKNIICWTNYGSSANKNTLKDLRWILETIFNTTATEFLKEYKTRTEYNRLRDCINGMVETGVKAM